MRDPKGPVKPYKTPKEIAAKHNVSLNKIIQQVKIGTKVEGEHTTSKSGAKISALQHVDELPDYYTKLKKVEKGTMKKEDVSVEQQYEKDTKYCLLCKKNEKRSECSYGPQMWDRYTIAKIHPANESKIHEDHKEIASGKMKDEEGYMANIEMDKIERSVQILRKVIRTPKQQLPAWVQSKITRAADFIDTAAEYLSSDEMSEEYIDEKKGLWDNIHARRKKGLPPKKPGEKGYPKTLDIEEGLKQARANVGASKCWTNKKVDPNKPTKMKGGKEVPNCVPANEDTCLSFSQFMQIAEGEQSFPMKRVAKQMKKARQSSVYGRDGGSNSTPTDSEQRNTTRFSKMFHASQKAKRAQQNAAAASRSSTFYRDTHPASAPKMKKANEEVEIAEVAAWQRKEGKNPSGGLNERGRKSYERENPGSDLKAPQPEGGPRKRSFCARMGGMPGPMKDEKGRPTRKALALRKWKC